jgi:hypothetical protein
VPVPFSIKLVTAKARNTRKAVIKSPKGTSTKCSIGIKTEAQVNITPTPPLIIALR